MVICGDMVFFHGLCRYLDLSAFMDYGLPEDKFSAPTHLRHIGFLPLKPFACQDLVKFLLRQNLMGHQLAVIEQREGGKG